MENMPDMGELMKQIQQGGGQMMEEMQQQLQEMMKQLQQQSQYAQLNRHPDLPSSLSGNDSRLNCHPGPRAGILRRWRDYKIPIRRTPTK